jgi:hypothetical protein
VLIDLLICPLRRFACLLHCCKFGGIAWCRALLAALQKKAERGALAPLLAIMTTRPEFRPPWGARSYHGTMRDS